MKLELKNPHSILEVIRHRPQAVKKLEIPKKLNTSSWEKVASEAKKARISTSEKSSEPMAQVLPKEPVAIEDLFHSEDQNGLWLALDCLQDVHNVGAIFRTASFFGVKGILLTEERSAPMNSKVYDIASGGVESIPFTMVKNLKRAFDHAKQNELWILGTSEHRGDPLQSLSLDRKWLLTLGNEENGIRTLTEKSCDVMSSIAKSDQKGVGSLNVSVAAGVMISHFLS